MNIHFNDTVLFEKLKSASIAKVKIGSHLYGTNNINSDEDYLYIYATSENELNSFIQTNHQLQYKENGIDHNFVSLHTFIRNIINGDSPINFEVVHSNELIGTDIEFLNTFKNFFITYTTIKSYLGFAKRDIKYWNKANNEYDKRKRLMHIVRAYMYADDMLSNKFNFNNVNNIIKCTYNHIEVDYNTVEFYSEKIQVLRNKLNYLLNFNNLNLPKILKVSEGEIINQRLLMYINTNEFKDKQNILKDFNLSLFINAVENWVEYDK